LSGPGLAELALRILFLLLAGALLALHLVALPANWIVLALAVGYALLTGMDRLGWGTLGVMAGLALLGELLEFLVGLGYTAKRGVTRRGIVGSFLGGILGAMLAAPIAPPFGSLLGAFAGSFGGAVLLEYGAARRADVALRAGKAAFVGRVMAALVKSWCGFWMWCLLAYRLLWPR
jgi:uncharacterized protein YqgC (DUF456 family)